MVELKKNKQKEYARKWREKNREKYNRYQREYRNASIDRKQKHAEVCAAYEPSDETKEKIKNYRHEYYLANKHKWAKVKSDKELGLK